MGEARDTMAKVKFAVAREVTAPFNSQPQPLVARMNEGWL
jgi:hypothetical protein